MKSSILLKTSMILLIVFIINSGSVCAQNEIPTWATQLPVKKGFVFGVGKAESSDLAMAGDMARIAALRDLTNNYSGKFESYAAKCDTILGADNKIREIVNTIKLQQEAKLKGVEAIEKKVIEEDTKTIVYLLLRVDVSDQIALIRKEIDSDKKLRRKMDENGLLKELNGM